MRLPFMRFPLLEPAGEGGGAAGGVAGGEGEGSVGVISGGECGSAGEGASGGEGGSATSAFAQKKGGEGGSSGEGGSGGEGGSATSAFAQKKGGEGGSAGEGDGKPSADDLLGMSDEDWAKAVLPDDNDAEGHDIDRTFMTQMAQVARENGVTPSAMQKMSARFQELAKAQMAKEDEARAKEAARVNEANIAAAREAVAAFSDNQWENIRVAGEKYIPADSELGRLMEGPLGSNQQLLTILNLLGETLRGDTPPTTGAAGSGRSVDEAVVAKTVPREFL